ncbi:GNAT family N-acetyltransferase [Abyssisolibacter fermentans]|uniref:GNAT family N-acetyltransferase n=1 Tax=Abyssisolibacter fermentans TaxID=1766203 RepID=UPI000829C86E|nr:GNAT family N-acetyltransferase [Abyssisolibacter fermentans]
MSICIETRRLVLRQFSIEDAVELHKICNESYILKWMPDWRTSLEDMKGWIKWIDKQYDKATKETARIMLAVTLKSTGKLIGMVGIGNKEEVDNEIEIAYFISEKYCNNAYISEAVKSMIEWAFEILKLEFIIAIVEIDNYPSQRVVEKCCFTKLDTRMILNSGDTEEKPFYYYRRYNSSTR